MNPGTLNIFKKSAATKIGLILPTYNERKFVDKTGAIIIDAAKATGTDGENIIYGWQDKITFALGVADICNLLENIETKKLVHEHKNKTKSLNFKEGSEKFAGTWMMTIYETEGSVSRSVSVPFSNGEFQSLGLLIRAAVPKVLGW